MKERESVTIAEPDMGERMKEAAQLLEEAEGRETSLWTIRRVLTVTEAVIAGLAYMALTLNWGTENTYLLAAMFWAVAAARAIADWRWSVWNDRADEAACEWMALRAAWGGGGNPAPSPVSRVEADEDDGK